MTADVLNPLASGRAISRPGASITHVREGRILAQRDTRDRAALVEPRGVGPAP